MASKFSSISADDVAPFLVDWTNWLAGDGESPPLVAQSIVVTSSPSDLIIAAPQMNVVGNSTTLTFMTAGANTATWAAGATSQNYNFVFAIYTEGGGEFLNRQYPIQVSNTITLKSS